MGFTGVKVEDDKALQLCRERKRFVKQALDGRCLLAETHVLYIQSLRNTGTALRRLVEPEVPSVSSLYTSTSATPEPLALTEKSISQSHRSYSSPSHSQNVEVSEQFSPVPSPLSSGRFHVNYMKAGRRTSTIIEEKPPINATATIQQASETPKSSKLQSDGHLSPETPSTPPWDYFDIFHPIDSQFSFHDGRSLEHDFENADDLRRLREEEGIPELEEDRENASRNGNTSVDSEDDFEQPSPKNLVRKFKNQNELPISRTKSEPPISYSSKDVAAESEQRDEEKIALANGAHGSVANSSMTPSKSESSLLAPPMNGKEKEVGTIAKVTERDFVSCMKDIEDLFLRASDSGREVPRMLEANKINFRPLFPEEKARRAKASNFFSSCFTCCIEGAQHPPVPAPNEEVKYLTWHKSASSLSSSSRIPLAPGSKDDSEDFSNNFGGLCMNSGSHASTLDRLFAWEKKLYDEVKACGLIRRDYDMKCRELREEESKGVISARIDKIRAAVKDLHSRIQVAIHRIDSISKRIEEVRDKELQPQLEELIGGLTRMWTMMRNCHSNQYNIVSLARKNGSMRISLRSESHRQAVVLLELELSSLSSNFTKWISAHKDYLLAINGWLHKCIFLLKQQKSSRRRKPDEFDPKKDGAPPIFITCKEWLSLLDNPPIKDVEDAIKQLIDVVSHLMPRLEKTRGKPKLSLSLSRKASGFNQLGEDILRNEVPVDWSLDLDSLQVSLENLLANLKIFAERSVEKYDALQKAINSARKDYEGN